MQNMMNYLAHKQCSPRPADPSPTLGIWGCGDLKQLATQRQHQHPHAIFTTVAPWHLDQGGTPPVQANVVWHLVRMMLALKCRVSVVPMQLAVGLLRLRISVENLNRTASHAAVMQYGARAGHQ